MSRYRPLDQGPGGYVSNLGYGPYGNYGTYQYPSSTGGSAMPPAIIAGGIAAAGALGSAALQSRAAGKATEAQTGASREALAFSREQAARGENAYQQQWEYWRATRDALAKHLGIDITPPGMGGEGGAPGPQVAGGGAPGPRGGAGPLQGRTLGELAEGGSGRGAWNDWGTMGLGSRRARA